MVTTDQTEAFLAEPLEVQKLIWSLSTAHSELIAKNPEMATLTKEALHPVAVILEREEQEPANKEVSEVRFTVNGTCHFFLVAIWTLMGSTTGPCGCTGTWYKTDVMSYGYGPEEYHAEEYLDTDDEKSEE